LPASEIDASLRWPLLALFCSSILWLIVGSALALLAAIKMHKGDFFADCPWLTLGRIRPASQNALLYGFASQAALGLAYWLLCRLGNVRFVYQVAVLIGTKAWNIGVTVGVIALLAGASTGFAWLEMPRYAAGILFAAYALLGLCAVGTFQTRRVRELYPTQWFIFAALFWFPWLYSAAYYLLVLEPVRGTFQAVVNAWFVGGFGHVWLGLIALGTLYYFLPKLSGEALHSSYLAAFAFWTILVFGSWAGMASLQGAPVPRWVPSAGVAATFCLIVPLVSNGINWCRTSCPMALFKKSVEARFFMLGLGGYFAVGIVDLILACPLVNNVTGLTLAPVGAKALLVHGFVSPVLLGAMYYILPRLLQISWPSEKMVRIHFGLQAGGVILIFLGLTVGGIVQGFKMAQPTNAMVTIARGTTPFVGLATLGVFLLLIGQGALALNLFQLVRKFIEPMARALCADICGCCGPVARAGVKP
jgi:cytochrome c oxidase cbb3-type subunit 1